LTFENFYYISRFLLVVNQTPNTKDASITFKPDFQAHVTIV